MSDQYKNQLSYMWEIFTNYIIEKFLCGNEMFGQVNKQPFSRLGKLSVKYARNIYQVIILKNLFMGIKCMDK